MEKRNLSLIIGLAIPVILVLVLAAIIYFPRTYVKPDYDFIYVTGDYPTYFNLQSNKRIDYQVIDGRLTSREADIEDDYNPYRSAIDPQFYRYDIDTQSNIHLTVEEVKQLNLDPSKSAPDGFTLNHGRGADNIFEAIFGGRDSSTYILEKDAVAQPVDLVANTARFGYAEDVIFIGWVIP